MCAKGLRGRKIEFVLHCASACRALAAQLCRAFARSHPIHNRQELGPIAHVARVQMSAIVFHCANERAEITPRSEIRRGQRRLRLTSADEEHVQVVETPEQILPGFQRGQIGSDPPASCLRGEFGRVA